MILKKYNHINISSMLPFSTGSCRSQPMKTEKKSYTKYIKVWYTILLLSMTVAIIGMGLSEDWQHFKEAVERIRHDYTEHQKSIIKNEVMHTVHYIRDAIRETEDSAKQTIKNRVYEAYDIAENIYRQYESELGREKTESIIIDALRPIRFADRTGYFFIIRLDGTALLCPAYPELENKNLTTLQDNKGNYVVKDMISIVQKQGEGFYDYFWTKIPDENGSYKKLSFIKLFKPYNILIGTGLYTEDINRQTKEKILDQISKRRFGKEGYIFVNSFNGEALVSNGVRLKNHKKLWDIFGRNTIKH
jgi:signal transduction histidine kinase